MAHKMLPYQPNYPPRPGDTYVATHFVPFTLFLPADSSWRKNSPKHTWLRWVTATMSVQEIFSWVCWFCIQLPCLFTVFTYRYILQFLYYTTLPQSYIMALFIPLNLFVSGWIQYVLHYSFLFVLTTQLRSLTYTSSNNWLTPTPIFIWYLGVILSFNSYG